MVIAVITSIVCVASTFWVINTYVDLLLEQFQIKPAVSAAPDWPKFTARLGKQLAGFRFFGGDPYASQDSRPVLGSPSAADVKGSEDSSNSRTGDGTSNQPPSKSGSGTGGSGKKAPPDDAVAVFGQQSGSSTGSSGTEGKVIVTGEEFTRKKEQLSSGDRNNIFNLLVTRVPQKEMQNISQMMEDGITAGELKEIEQVLQKYLKPEEYSQLLSMIKQ
jgi:hypothetical protein